MLHPVISRIYRRGRAVGLVLAGRLAYRLPLPEKHKRPLVAHLGERTLLALMEDAVDGPIRRTGWPHPHSLPGELATHWRNGHFTKNRTDLPYPPPRPREEPRRA